MLTARAAGVLRTTGSPRGLAHLLHARCKTSTGIVGLPVQPEAKAILEGLYTKTLSALEAFPASAEYAKVVGGIAKERLAVVKSAASLPEIEAKIGAGQVEQLIEQAHTAAAEDELRLLPVMLEERVWEAYQERVWEAYQGAPADDLYLDLKRRGITLQRFDIPMRPSQDFPTTEAVELIEAAEPEK
ncbi:NDUFA5/B13 subunit of NADH:ubiquinone oxidoreductase [Emiliania huxleyi CCMP1516]|uniref:Uncharacterized protein n=2 Tax=Emiliania huxleyi TaxID=2903 RepID=A0A0D3JIC5_EMIH1|nr:NDUFA5/B13 subunit of NADH:ubiquinone oxidoreductase [Emiliania huxleyi CCMP1516]EOD23260.1 NDUFA5/B13 subunit of NADH:ubiquinone oxidoreductase [Emiliania huxleyi CCMP1516]|eukprot:XP_005775689.1 NDUFA5/B13 subunit of NADH:ubiquinone oxidoreductase [Emiliania huxleyi CCMP1516]